jgi:hypothetical protein
MPKEGGPINACFAWSSTFFRLPFQWAEIWPAALSIVGEFLGFGLQLFPTAFLSPSTA